MCLGILWTYSYSKSQKDLTKVYILIKSFEISNKCIQDKSAEQLLYSGRTIEKKKKKKKKKEAAKSGETL